MKRILYLYLMVILLLKAVSCGYLILSGTSGLPASIFAVSLVLVVFGAVVIFRHYSGKERPNELAFYSAAFIVGTLFCLIFVNREVLSDIGFFEMAVTGNLFDIVVAAIATFAFWKRPVGEEKQTFVAPVEEAVSKAQ